MWQSLRPLLLIALAALAGCQPGPEDGTRVRIALMARLTHAPAISAIDSGRLGAALGPVRVESRVFEVGNAIVEALLASETDLAFVGPNPAINGFVRSGGAIRILAGATSGGALFVVREGSLIRQASDLRGKRIATPQLASTQDIALRAYLRRHGLAGEQDGGDVVVLPMSSATIRLALRRGQIDGAWVPEPLASQLIMGAGARVFVDERDEWADRAHPTTVLAVRSRFFEAHPQIVERVLAAHTAEVHWLEAHREQARALVERGIERRLDARLPDVVSRPAWARLTFATDPMPLALTRLAGDAQLAGYLPKGAPIDGLVLPLSASARKTPDGPP